ncbi:hypothetical protein [Thalassomonas sp. RHCl1]|uniref:hypothetical protein n=1 Tax=Thalassomonas sp. RHCl1 TaxID=2995320 RepID=UPI00248AAF88|nr:hypothetical protein [Thalassomonas sp. RHCl1]
MAKVNDKPEFFSVKVFLTTKSDSTACHQMLKTRSTNHHPKHTPPYSSHQQAAKYLSAVATGGQCDV